MSPPSEALSPAERHKQRSGLVRLWHAAGFSLAGLRAGWGETAFRQEVLAAVVLVPSSFWLGSTWVEIALLAGSVLLVLILMVERGREWHELSKRAKDMGSAAVLLSVLICAGIWAAALYQRFFA